jgi:hypothetical protein
MCVVLQFVKYVGVCTNMCCPTICEVCRSLYINVEIHLHLIHMDNGLCK